MLTTATKGHRYFPPGSHVQANRFTGLGISLRHLPEYSWASYVLTQCQDLQASACSSLIKRTQRPSTVRCLSYHKSPPGVMPPSTVRCPSLSRTFPQGSHARDESIHRLRHIFAHLQYSWARYALTQWQNLQASACKSLITRTQGQSRYTLTKWPCFSCLGIPVPLYHL